MCSTIITSILADIHNKLCHSGITQLLHYIRARNLPFSTEDVKKIGTSSQVCAKIKPYLYSSPEGTLIKATKTMEWLGIDFK